MTGAAEQAPLLPRLTSLDFNIAPNHRNFSERALRRFVRSRSVPSVRGGCSVVALERVRASGIYDNVNDFEGDGRDESDDDVEDGGDDEDEDKDNEEDDEDDSEECDEDDEDDEDDGEEGGEDND